MPAQPPQYQRYWLAMHGSYAPGGDDHFRLSDLRGEWHRGTMPGTPGAVFSAMVASRSHEPTDAWAFELADEDSTATEMYDRWVALDEVFGDSVARVDVEFTFAEANLFAEGADAEPGPRVVPANTYASPAAVSDGRYDSPHPEADPVDLWLEVVAGDKDYDPRTFLGMINGLSPDRYEEVFAGLPNHTGFVSRLRRLVADQTPPGQDPQSSVYFTPQEHNAVDDAMLVSLARAQVDALRAVAEQVADEDESQALSEAIAALDYRVAQTGDAAERGSLHYELDEHVGDSQFAERSPWTDGLGEACYSIAASYELAAWLTQDWNVADVDLEPLYALWRAGGRVKISDAGVCHVVATWAQPQQH